MMRSPGTPDRRPSLSERIYRRLLLLLPGEFQGEYRAEMEEAFRRHEAEAAVGAGRLSGKGRRSLARLWLSTLADLARTAPREHLDALVQDVRFTVRAALRSPGFAAVVVGTFALAVGANSAIFTVVDTTLLRPLPFADENELVRLVHVRERPDGTSSEVSFSRRDLHAVREQAESIAAATAQVYQGPGLSTVEGGLERVVSIGVSGSWFRTLGLRPALGRVWDEVEEAAGRDSRVVVLSDSLWQRRFAGDPSIVGRQVALDGEPHTVIAVMPPGFAYPYAAELWRLWTFDPDDGVNHNLNAQARLAPGVTLAEAQAELDLISERQAAAYPETSRGYRIVAQPTRENLIEGEDRLVLLLLAGVGLVLLIAAANVVTLLMARTVARGRELAVRASLGASGWRRARQLMTENVVLALIGGAGGLVIARLLREPLVHLAPNHIQEIFGEIAYGRSVVGFAVVLSVAVGALVGAVAAWSARSINLSGTLHGGAAAPRSQRLLGTMVVAETALTVAVLTGAVLLAFDLHLLATRDAGIDPEGLVSMAVALPEDPYESGAERLLFQDELIARVEAIPGVERAAVVNLFPYDDGNALVPFLIEGEGLPREEAHVASYRAVTPGYFATLGIPVLRGRGLTGADRDGGPPVAVVNRSFADRFFPGSEALGRRFERVGGGFDGRSYEVVGVVGDVEDPRLEPVEMLYVAMDQHAIDSTSWSILQPTLAVKSTGGDPTRVVPAVRAALRRLDASVPAFQVRTADQSLDEALVQRRTGTLLAISFAALGLLLAAVGTYGVIAYSVSRSVRELGVRLAIGATRGQVLRGVLVHGGRLVALGICIGLVGAFVLSRGLAGVLSEVAPGDPRAYGAVALLLGAVGLAACLEPAWRATRADPSSALRSE